MFDDSQDIEILTSLSFPVDPERYVTVCPVIDGECRAHGTKVVNLRLHTFEKYSVVIGDVEVVMIVAQRTHIDLGRDLKVGVTSWEESRVGGLKEAHWPSSPDHLVESHYYVPVTHTPSCTPLHTVDPANRSRCGSESDVGIVD